MYLALKLECEKKADEDDESAAEDKLCVAAIFSSMRT